MKRGAVEQILKKNQLKEDFWITNKIYKTIEGDKPLLD